MKNKGFTLIELIVVIAIIAVLSAIILFSITLYINKGKDSNVSGNLAVLMTAGETYYNANGSNGYSGFCQSNVVSNAISQMPIAADTSSPCYDSAANPAGVCCNAGSDSWAACAQEFSDNTMAYCVDSRGVREEICNSSCRNNNLTQCPNPTTQINCS